MRQRATVYCEGVTIARPSEIANSRGHTNVAAYCEGATSACHDSIVLQLLQMLWMPKISSEIHIVYEKYIHFYGKDIFINTF